MGLLHFNTGMGSFRGCKIKRYVDTQFYRYCCIIPVGLYILRFEQPWQGASLSVGLYSLSSSG